MRNVLKTILVMVMFFTLGARAQAASPSEFKRARNLFEYGDYRAAIPLLEAMVLPGKLENEDDAAAAHRMLAVAYFQTGKKAEAAREFKSLLYLNPDAVLDPFLTPPDVVEYFDSVKADMADRLPQLREMREQEKKQRERTKEEAEARAKPAPAVAQVLVRKVRVVPLLAFFVPGGVPQFMMNHPIRGTLALLVLAGAPLPSLVFFLAARLSVSQCVRSVGQQFLEGGTGGIQCDPRRDTAVSASDSITPVVHAGFTLMQWASLALVPLAYGAGVLDAFILPDAEIPEGPAMAPESTEGASTTGGAAR